MYRDEEIPLKEVIQRKAVWNLNNKKTRIKNSLKEAIEKALTIGNFEVRFDNAGKDCLFDLFISNKNMIAEILEKDFEGTVVATENPNSIIFSWKEYYNTYYNSINK